MIIKNTTIIYPHYVQRYYFTSRYTGGGARTLKVPALIWADWKVSVHFPSPEYGSNISWYATIPVRLRYCLKTGTGDFIHYNLLLEWFHSLSNSVKCFLVNVFLFNRGTKQINIWKICFVYSWNIYSINISITLRIKRK